MQSASESSCCRICAISGGSLKFGEIDAPWMANGNFLAFASIGALVEGWSLLSPREHVLNLAKMYGDAKFENFLSHAVSVVSEAYGHAAIFEHGVQAEGSLTGCGTNHAHLHIVPAAFSVEQSSIEFDESLDWQPCLSTDIAALAGRKDYLFVSDDYLTEGRGLLAVLDEGRSQFFRHVVSHQIGRPAEFNYRDHPQLTTSHASASKLRSLLLSRE